MANIDNIQVGIEIIECKECERVKLRHGYWKTLPNTDGYEVNMRCSVCHFQFDNWKTVFNYCPVCGSLMDERWWSE